MVKQVKRHIKIDANVKSAIEQLTILPPLANSPASFAENIRAAAIQRLPSIIYIDNGVSSKSQVYLNQRK